MHEVSNFCKDKKKKIMRETKTMKNLPSHLEYYKRASLFNIEKDDV